MSRIRPNQLLLPSILDRLLDFEPNQSTETPPERAQKIRDLRASVRRDLEDLLNTRVSLVDCPPDLEETFQQCAQLWHPGFRCFAVGLQRPKRILAQENRGRYPHLRNPISACSRDHVDQLERGLFAFSNRGDIVRRTGAGTCEFRIAMHRSLG